MNNFTLYLPAEKLIALAEFVVERTGEHLDILGEDSELVNSASYFFGVNIPDDLLLEFHILFGEWITTPL